jgi:hypothetical protein
MNISKKLFGSLALLAFMAIASAPAFATSGSGSVAVTATTTATVSITFVTDGSGISLTGSGTSAATIPFGSVQAYGGSVPTGVTKTINAPSNWTLSTPFDVLVEVANQTSTDYTLTAELTSTDSVNTWALGATPVTAASPATITSSGTYNSATPYTLNLTIPFSEVAGSISNTINFVATAN